jgi:xanthine dehydrogenase accessory factor
MITELYQEINRIIAAGEEAALATIVSASGSTPREVGAKMLIRADGSIMGTVGGGSLEAEVIKQAAGVIKAGQSRQFNFNLTAEGGDLGMICGGDTDVFIEPLAPPPALYIFGGGHISLPLAKIGKLVGFTVGVIDDRAEFANPQRFPEADLVLATEFSNAFTKLAVNKSGYIVIVTRNHAFDELVLELALGTPARYIGMIGSKSKNRDVFNHLLAKGISKEQIDRVHAPIGLKISAQTPEEIAVSIMAEVINVRRSQS